MTSRKVQLRLVVCAGLFLGIGSTIVEAHWCSNGGRLTQIERAICSDAGLISKDIQLNSLYKSLGGQSNGGLKASQRTWMRGRNSCNSMGCLHAYYDSRLGALRTMSGGYSNPVAPPPPSPPVVTYTPRPPSALPPPVVSVPPAAPSGTQSEPLTKLPDIKPF